MDRREKYKQQLIKRLRGRKEEPDFDQTPELSDEEAQEETQWGFLEPLENENSEDFLPEEELEVTEYIEEEPFLTQEMAQVFFKEGYDAFIGGTPLDANPMPLLEQGTEEERVLAAQVWEEGWSTGRKDQLLADIVLAARELIETDDEELAAEMFSFMTERVKDLSEVVDMEAYELFWWPEEE